MPNLTPYAGPMKEDEILGINTLVAVGPARVTNVKQENVNAGGNVVAGDLTVNNYYTPQTPSGTIDQLLARLDDEMKNDVQIRHTIETLAQFKAGRITDGIVGLEAKLKAGNREHELLDALEEKEQFAKLLETWSLYSSAQQIFAHLLARATIEYRFHILPMIPHLPQVQINQLVKERIVDPTVKDCGASVFALNHTNVVGMVYWLAEQCFVRWH